MASRLFASSSSTAFRALARPSALKSAAPSRTFQSAARLMNDTAAATTVAAPARRPVGAFRGGILGFLAGTSAAAYGTYYYVLEEYRLANELLTEDIYALQAAVQRIHDYVGSLEERVERIQRGR